MSEVAETAEATLKSIKLLEESIKREVRFHKLFTEYTVTPSLSKNFTVSQKPNNVIIAGSQQEEEDEEYKKLHERLNKPPKEKFLIPQTSAQEYGWDSEPLMKPIRDRRFYHPKVSCEMTRFQAQNLKLMNNGGGEKEKK